MERDPGADLVKAMSLAVFALMAAASCAGSTVTPDQQQSTAGHIATTTQGSPGSVFFVTDKVGWVLTIPPDRLKTVIFRTGDGGAHWQLWGVAPVIGVPLGFNTGEVMLHVNGADGTGVERSGDGTNWSFASTPTTDTPFFLPDLRHGWIFGFVPEAPCPACVPAAKGGPPAPPPPSGVWYTDDGGATWRMQMQASMGDVTGSVYFWSPTAGELVQPSPSGFGTGSILVTHDAGVTWKPLSFDLPPPVMSRKGVTVGPLTMFDPSHGMLLLTVSDFGLPDVHYVSQTSDGGVTWSTPQVVTGCSAQCAGQLYFLDGRHWLAVTDRVLVSSDAGLSWRAASTTTPAKATSAVEVLHSAPGTVVALAPSVIASMTTDWGTHWRPVGLPQIYRSYTGVNGIGGWPFCCV